MRLKLILIYVLIAFSSSSILKSEDKDPILNESINNVDSITEQSDFNKNKTHEVKEGDTLSSIARTYLINVSSIIEANNLSDENLIFIGQKLNIPENISIDLNKSEIDPTKFHEVKSGDTLTGISLLYGIDIDKLIKINNIDDIESINIGTRILLDEINTIDEIKIKNEELILENKIDQKFEKEYGPLKIISPETELKHNREILNAINRNGRNIIISLNCDKDELDVRATGRQWKGWLPAEKEFEKSLLNDFCKNIND